MQPPNVEPPDEIPVIRPELARPRETAPRARPGAAAPGTSRRIAFALALAAALAAVLGVVFVLPDLLAPAPPAPVASAPEPAGAAAEPGAAPALLAPGALDAVRDPVRDPTRDPARAPGQAPEPDAEAERAAQDKREAEAGLAAVLRAKAALEASEVDVWAPDAWPQALARLEDADARFAAGAFVDALAGYESVLEAFAALDASRAGRLERALAEGAAALEAGDGAAARAAFRIALALEPGNDAAALGARRAETIEEALALVADGERLEADDALGPARERYAAALALDEHLALARESLIRVEAEILRRAFAAAMSTALAALDRGDLGATTKALAAAEKLVPGTPEVRDVRARVTAARQLRRIEARRREAEEHAAAERWAEASAAYAGALEVDRNLAFAVAGKARADALVRLHRELDAFIAEPGRLADGTPLAKARAVVADARGLPERGPALAAKLETVEALVAAAGQPVSVLMLSDGATEVTVYRVARLGVFESRQLTLRPGRYVAVGTRPGYRDVRVEFEVAPGRTGAPVLVRCEEPV